MNDNTDLIERLLAAAGAIMEDASALAIDMGTGSSQRDRVKALLHASGEIDAIARAATALLK